MVVGFNIIVKGLNLMGLLNLGSLLLGLVAWILPIINLAKYKKIENKNWIVLSLASIGACTISLWMQILYTNHLVNISDWSALMDTFHAVVLASSVLLAITVILNIVTLVVYLKNRK